MKKNKIVIGILIVLLIISCGLLWNRSNTAASEIMIQFPSLSSDGIYSLGVSTTDRITDKETVETILYILTTAEPFDGSAPDAVGDVVLGLSDPTNTTSGNNVTLWFGDTVLYSPGQGTENGLYRFSDAHAAYLWEVLTPFLKNSRFDY